MSTNTREPLLTELMNEHATYQNWVKLENESTAFSPKSVNSVVIPFKNAYNNIYVNNKLNKQEIEKI
jgi:hypothetical protein